TDDAPYPSAYLRPVAMLSGGAGLVSTLPDMEALVRRLLPGGPTLVQRETIAVVKTKQVPAGERIRFPRSGELRGRGFGLAGALILEPRSRDHRDSFGELYWGGSAGTQWWISPKANVAGLIMTQRQMTFFHPFVLEIKQLVYEQVKRKS